MRTCDSADHNPEACTPLGRSGTCVHAAYVSTPAIYIAGSALHIKALRGHEIDRQCGLSNPDQAVVRQMTERG
jgi:hypothetical protein